MTEAELQAEVTRLARGLGLICLHLRAPHREGDWAGFPDLWIIRPGGGPGAEMFRELKAPGNDLRANQKHWQRILAGRDAGVWKPADWHVGDIQRELHALAGTRYAEPEPGSLTPKERLMRALRDRAAADAAAGREDRR